MPINLSDIISAESVICHADATTKKQVFELISRRISDLDDDINYRQVLDALLQRERLGSTAIGHGIAIPHARVKNLSSAKCVILTLKDPIEFEPEEHVMVNIVVGLLVPENTDQLHLDILAAINDKLRDEEYRNTILAAQNSGQLYMAVVENAFADQTSM